MNVTKELIYEFINQQKLGVVSTVNPDDKPEAAVVGIAISVNLEIVFDTVKTSRKYLNILNKPNVALAIGWDDEITVQYEGVAEILGDNDGADNLREVYFRAFPDGRERAETWPGLVHIKVTPNWLRYSNYNEPQQIEELTL
ncbi:pyridoxamine 5'-phosphate oxidase family protein [Mucilaginibacter sp. BT774]|uniref:pyridoxamine 5'-phosphate oxidase family protein n=1 Tax=Mucilaginibacter sp. BT774 TaxID=3062276 RepID=UPI0026753460|nr:pyridoxamine 5'-phosphate oxidase family protein [Mucilaginibacter sp. BT774]MDO3627875.1 pyridoxamine 5'-phosphate oxidase family protein [Mucilaginibacter sp. BT774]